MQKLLTIDGWHIRPEFIVGWAETEEGVEVLLTTGTTLPIPTSPYEFGKALQRVLRHNSDDLKSASEDFEEYEC